MRTITLALALLGCVACSAHARPVSQAPAPAVAASDPSAVLGAPPAPGSDEARADLAVVLWLQRTRSAEDVARATRQIRLGLDAFAAALAPGFDASAHPRTRELLDLVHARATRTILDAKKEFARPRPYQADPRVAPAVERENTFSYPSSHATRGVLVARVLAELAPSRREALLEAGLRAGYDRVVAGVHYPSDVLAGQRLGAALADAFLVDPDVRAKLEAARAAEWAGSAAP